MPQCVVIADDLTGGNATGVRLVRAGMKTYTFVNKESLSSEAMNECDCVIFPTDSRSATPEEAYNRVFSAVKAVKSEDVKLYSKRIDSTLRGNLGCETDAMLDALGNGAVALALPSFPQSKRTMIDGVLLVDGTPLHETDVARDPKNPVKTPYCAEIYRMQSKYPVGSLFLKEVEQGVPHIAECIKKLANEGARTIVCDAVTQEDIDKIADAAILSDVSFISADPGVFTATLAERLVKRQMQMENKRVLVTVGSVNAVASEQARIFLEEVNTLNVFADTSRFLESEQSREAEIERVSEEIINNYESYGVCSVIGNGIFDEHRLSFEKYAESGNTFDELSEKINDAFAEITCRILSKGGFGGLYTCGGDITIAVCRRMKTAGMRLLDEVLPLAAYGELIGGDYENLKVVTKGGMVGEADAIVRCVKHLQERINQESGK